MTAVVWCVCVGAVLGAVFALLLIWTTEKWNGE